MLWWIWPALLAALALFLVAPGRAPAALRGRFSGRCYAHRGLFGQRQDPPENSLPAFAAAVQAGYGIELDVQFTADRRLVVFHDDTVDRMTGGHGPVRAHTLAQLQALPLAGSGEHAPLFAEVLQTVAGRVPLIVEIKAGQQYDGAYLDALCCAVLDALQGYAGDYCIESFDPRVVRRVRQWAPGVLRGQLVDEYRAYRKNGAGRVGAFLFSHCAFNFLCRPQFIAWCPAPPNGAVRLCRRLGAMLVNWTALPSHDHAALQKRYDAIIFQWYRP